MQGVERNGLSSARRAPLPPFGPAQSASWEGGAGRERTTAAGRNVWYSEARAAGSSPVRSLSATIE